jgi:effector-binding domain-containing protein
MEQIIRLEQIQSVPLAVVRRRARQQDLPKVVPDACGTVWTVMRAQQVKGAGRHIAIYFYNQINLEVGVELETPFEGHGEVVGSATPAGLVAATTHYGPYSLLHQAHQVICQWCQKNGYELAGPNWEIYGHWKEEWNSDPTKIVTDVYYLLAAPKTRPARPLRPPQVDEVGWRARPHQNSTRPLTRLGSPENAIISPSV